MSQIAKLQPCVDLKLLVLIPNCDDLKPYRSYVATRSSSVGVTVDCAPSMLLPAITTDNEAGN